MLYNIYIYSLYCKQKMEINSLEGLVKYVKAYEPEDGLKAIVEYGNKRVEACIEQTWARTRSLIRWTQQRRKKSLKNAILDYDETNETVHVLDVINFVASIEDELKNVLPYVSELFNRIVNNYSTPILISIIIKPNNAKA